MELKQVTYEQLVGAIALVFVLIGLYNVAMAAVKAHREESKVRSEPIAKVNARLNEHESWLAADKRRLEALEQGQKAILEHDKQQDRLSNIQVRAQLAMLRHMQHGNNLEGMNVSEKEITDYLTGKE